MEITGTITKVLPLKSGTTKKGGTWTAQQYVLEADESGEKTGILLEVFGQKEIDEFAITEGETITVTYIPKVHEFNGSAFGKNSVTAVSRPQAIEE